MRKERLYFLDFIRALAAVMILLTHYNAHFLHFYLENPVPEHAIIALYPFNVYIGSVGVSLFFIISGAALMYVYGEKCKTAVFYKKRAFSIYPMFWLAYAAAYLYLFYVRKGNWFDTASMKAFPLTVIGMDGYLTGTVKTCYILGEWFLGCIILFYLVFPLMRKCLIQHPWLTWIIVMMLYVFFVWHNPFPMFSPSKQIPVRMPEFLFGMWFVRYRKKVSLYAALAGAGILVLNILLKPQISEHIQTTYVGISLFLVLVYLHRYLDSSLLRAVCKTVGKYSYAVFLTHHVIIDEITRTFSMGTINKFERYVLFLVCCVVTGIASVLLDKATQRCMLFGKER